MIGNGVGEIGLCLHIPVLRTLAPCFRIAVFRGRASFPADDFLDRLSGRPECDQKGTHQYEKESDGLLPEELFPEQQASGNKGDDRAAAPQDRDDGDGGTGDGDGAKVEIIGNDQEDAGGDDGPAESEGGRGFSRRAGGDRSNKKDDAVQDAETGCEKGLNGIGRELKPCEEVFIVECGCGTEKRSENNQEHFTAFPGKAFASTGRGEHHIADWHQEHSAGSEWSRPFAKEKNRHKHGR